MKTYIADIKKQEANNPCKNCDVGWGSISNGKDGKGEYIETKSCYENCLKLTGGK